MYFLYSQSEYQFQTLFSKTIAVLKRNETEKNIGKKIWTDNNKSTLAIEVNFITTQP